MGALNRPLWLRLTENHFVQFSKHQYKSA